MKWGIALRSRSPRPRSPPSASPGRRPRKGHRLEPPRGAADRGRPVRRQHRPLRVPQPGQAGHGHAHRELHPARGACRRAELLPLRRRRPVRDQDRQRRRREGGHHLPVPLQDDVTANPNTFLYNTGPINTLSDPDWNRPQIYSVTRIDHGNRRGDTQETVLASDLADDARQHRPAVDARTTRPLMGMGGLRPAGRRQGLRRPERRSVLRRPRLGLRPRRPAAVQPAHVIPLPARQRGRRRERLQRPHDRAADPDHELTRDGQLHAASDPRRRSASTRTRASARHDASERRLDEDARPVVQVSRLGQPARQRGRDPDSAEGQLERDRPGERLAVREPLPEPRGDGARERCCTRCSTTLRRRIAATSSRSCSRACPALNFTGRRRPTCCGSTPASRRPRRSAQGNRLAVLAGDLAGFPNGRRLEDDVVDIELRAFALRLRHGAAAASERRAASSGLRR